MSTQYNAVQKPYDELRKSTISLLERTNIRSMVSPFIENASVLDLACGSGFYSRRFLQWGARKVVGVDISSAMVDEARALGQSDKAQFIVANCDKPTEFPGGPFDIVFGAWFLNYAATGSEMVDMYRNILVNLKEGGHFVAVTPPPTNDPTDFIDRECQLRPLPTASGGLYSTVNNDVDGGVYFHLHSDTAAGDLDFDTYHLQKDVWEASASKAGFRSKIQWSVTHLPEDFMENPTKYGEQSNGGASAKELATYKELPHYGLLLLKKVV